MMMMMTMTYKTNTQQTPAKRLKARLLEFESRKESFMLTTTGLLEHIACNQHDYTLDEQAKAHIDLYFMLEANIKNPSSSTALCNITCELLDKVAFEFCQYLEDNNNAAIPRQ